MSFAWLVYWFSVLGKLGSAAGFFSVVALIVAVITLGVHIMTLDETEDFGVRINKIFLKIFKYCTFSGIVFTVISIFTPSERTMYTVVAASAAQTVVSNEGVTDVAKEGMDVVREFLKREKQRLIEETSGTSKK